MHDFKEEKQQRKLETEYTLTAIFVVAQEMLLFAREEIGSRISGILIC